MSKDEQKPKLAGPWRAVHAAIWLIGLAILAWQNWWWPGILVLVAISILAEAILARYAPQAFEKAEQPASSLPSSSALVQSSQVLPESDHPFELLPSECPRCGGPIRGHEVKWTGPRSADCPYCGANLPMGRSEKGPV
jgi:hypothetical protein